MSNPETRPELTDTRVLVVEDNEEHRYLLAAHLEKAGCTVASTGSAEEAIETYPQTLPHIVFTDVQLPGMSGFEFVTWLRERGLPIPCIVTTSVLDPSDHPSGDITLAKPFSRSQVHRVLDDFLALRNS